MHSQFVNGKLHGHAIINFSKGKFFLLDFDNGRIQKIIIKYDLETKRKEIFDSDFHLIQTHKRLDEIKLFQEVNRFLKKMRIKNSKSVSDKEHQIEIGNFRLGKDEWYNGIKINNVKQGFGIHHENGELSLIHI